MNVKNVKKNIIAGMVGVSIMTAFIGAHVAIDSALPIPENMLPDGTYKVVDEKSHLEMCYSNHVPISERAQCIMSARTTWK